MEGGGEVAGEGDFKERGQNRKRPKWKEKAREMRESNGYKKVNTVSELGETTRLLF